MRKIINASYTDYVFLFAGSRTAYSDLSVKGALKSDGRLYIMMEDDRPAGYLCIVNEENIARVLYVYTDPMIRNRGILKSLLKHACENADRKVKVCIADDTEAFTFIKRACLNLGFFEESNCIISGSGKAKDFSNWERYMDRVGNKFCEILIRQGFECVSFNEASENQIDELYHSNENEYKNPLSVKVFFDNANKCLDRNMSFLASKDGELAAYSLVSRPDIQSAVFEHISTAEKYMGSGCIFLPFARSMEEFKKSGCNRAAYAMYEDNVHANAFKKKLLERVTVSQHRSYNFVLNKIGGNGN